MDQLTKNSGPNFRGEIGWKRSNSQVMEQDFFEIWEELITSKI